VSQDSNTTPEWQPPSHLRDPFVRRLDRERALWQRASRGRIRNPSAQAVAAHLSGYGNTKGVNNHPGIARLVGDTCLSDRTVRRALGWLVENGWLTVTSKGARKLGHANVYQLTIPAPVAVEMGLWPDGEGQWIERPRSEPKRPDVAREDGRRHETPTRFVPVNEAVVPVNPTVLPVTGDLPPGLTHQGSTTSSRSSTSASSSDDAATDPDDSEAIVDEIEERLGGAMSPTVATMVDAMIEDGAHRKMIVRTALARERDGVA
jgi:hypothetical protein